MSVKRYEVNGPSSVFEDENGSLVDYKDYAALEQRLIESERYGRQTDITIDNLELKLAQMAAENAELKEALWWLYETVSSDGVSIPDEQYSSVTNAAQVLSEAPATDAFLAEVRASAIEELMEKSLWDTANCLHGIGAFDKANDRKAVQGIIRDELKERVTEFAAQIRKGVQS